MGQGRLEEDRLRLINSERVTFELFLIAYPLIFIKANGFFDAHYLWLGFSLAMGALTYIVFGMKNYSPTVAVVLALILAIPFFFLDLPIIVVLFLASYSFWRIHDNFVISKMMGWPFLVLNPIVFISFYLLTKPFFVNNNPTELLHSQLILFASTTVLYFIVRFAVVGMIGRRLNGFRVMDAGKLYGGLLGVGFLSYVAVFYLLIPVRNALIATVGFLFGGIFTFILKMITPVLDAFIERLHAQRAEMEVEPEENLGYSEFNMQDNIEIFGKNMNTSTIWLTSIVVVGLVVLFIWMRKRTNADTHEREAGFLFKSFGPTREQPTKRLVYDYSKTDGQVRNAFKAFEELAQSSKAPRLQGETVKEWFTRMGWQNNPHIFSTYDKARYGIAGVTEEEGHFFIKELEKLKTVLFEKDV